MNEISTSRRKFLAGTAAALSGLVIAGLPHFGYANALSAKNEFLDSYSPVFFNEREWPCLVAICDLLIPDDEVSPGALATLVPVYIDRQMLTEYGNGGLWYMHGPFYTTSAPQFGYQYRFTPRDIYRIGLKELGSYCQSAMGHTFEQLEEEKQTGVLGALEDGSLNFPSMPGSLFFRQVLTNTKEGFFADPQYGGNKNMAGWKMLGFPGAQGDYRKAITLHNQNLNIAPASIARKEG